jgi:predicted XRE-type DNA-binding protein
MTDNQFKKLSKDIESTNKLLILLLRKFEVSDDSIAGALGVTQGRLSQILPQKIKKERKVK